MNNLIVFDLDDTLYKEIDFLKSAFSHIANILDAKNGGLLNEMLKDYFEKKDVFAICEFKYNFPKDNLIKIYREYLPEKLQTEINLNEFLTEIKKEENKIGLITDGRSITQRNKLKSLKIESLFDKIIISEEIGSEKPSEKNYNSFDVFDVDLKCFVGDNISKDFITAKKLGWITFCLLDNGKNIHKQNFNLPQEYLPHFKIGKLTEVKKYINIK